MKERPILFNAPMVLAILSGTKTQTRRICKPAASLSVVVDCGDPETDCGPEWWGNEEGTVRFRCPYGQPGDRLWVREAIRLVPDQAPDDGAGPVLSVYAADNLPTVADAWPWRRKYLPPMHCPRGLSRILLEVVSARAERLQDISEADAMAEGVEFDSGWEESDGSNGHGWLDYMSKDDAYSCRTAVESYRTLWDSINGAPVIERDDNGNEIARRSFAWAANPFVWVVEFKAVQP